MKTLKRMLIAFMVVLMLVPMTAFAASSPKKVSIKNAVATAKTVTYTGERQKADITVMYNGEELVEGKDYKLVGTTSRKNAGTIHVTVKGIGKFKGTTTAKFTVKKAEQKVVVSTVSGKKSVAASALKNKRATLTLAAKGDAKNGKISFTSLDSRKVVVKKNGKIILRKGLKAGVYRIRVTVGRSNNFKADSKIIRITVK